MIVVEIPPNPNCEAVELRVFHDLEPPRAVSQVRLERQGKAQWCRLTGWTLAGKSCPAWGCRVDDSGEGVVLLVSGGEAGLRLQSGDRGGTFHAAEEVPQQAGAAAGQQHPWRLEDTRQWGAPFLLLADAQDVRFDDEQHA